MGRKGKKGTQEEHVLTRHIACRVCCCALRTSLSPIHLARIHGLLFSAPETRLFKVDFRDNKVFQLYEHRER